MFVLYFLHLTGPYPMDVSMYPLSFLLFAWAAFTMYGNVWFTFPVPC